MSRSFKKDEFGSKGKDSRRDLRNKKQERTRGWAEDSVRMDSIDRRKYFRDNPEDNEFQ